MKPHQYPFFLSDPSAVIRANEHCVRFRFVCAISNLNEISRHGNVAAIELLVHHDGYERKVSVPWHPTDPASSLQIVDEQVQYGGAISFSEIEVSLLYRDGTRSEPQFFVAPKEVKVYLPYRAANPSSNGG